MSTTDKRNNQRIAIIGAGPAGLSCAWFLQQQGYKKVTVLEKLGRVGGLCKSLTVEGRSFDIGANYVTWDYTETLKLAKMVGADTGREVPYTSIQISDDGTGEKAEYRDLEKAILVNPFTGKSVGRLKFFFTALRYFYKRLRLSKLIERPDYLARINKNTHPELCVTFADWLKNNALGDIGTMFQFPITIMGYGQLDSIAAPYALRYMSLKTSVPMVLLKIPFLGKILGFFLPWPRRFTLGFQRFFERLSWRLNVRLNVNITNIIRNPEDSLAPIIIDFTYPEQEMNHLKPQKVQMKFDHLIIACPHTKDNFANLNLDLDEEETKVLDKVQVNPYCMTTFWVDNLNMPQAVAPVFPIPSIVKKLPWAVARQYQDEGNGFTQFYTRSESWTGSLATLPDKERVIEQVRHLVDMLGGTIDDTQSHWHTFDRFTYFQHVEVNDIADGFYKSLAQLQGHNNTYYVGGVTDFELVEPIVRHSKYFAKNWFGC